MADALGQHVELVQVLVRGLEGLRASIRVDRNGQRVSLEGSTGPLSIRLQPPRRSKPASSSVRTRRLLSAPR